MTEKWMQNKPNRKVIVRKGNVNKMFADSDRDGVPNVFDCKPHNKRRQDVISPMSGSNPVHEMHQRAEYSRQSELSRRQLAEYYRQLQQNPTVVNVYPTVESGSVTAAGSGSYGGMFDVRSDADKAAAKSSGDIWGRSGYGGTPAQTKAAAETAASRAVVTNQASFNRPSTTTPTKAPSNIFSNIVKSVVKSATTSWGSKR